MDQHAPAAQRRSLDTGRRGSAASRIPRKSASARAALAVEAIYALSPQAKGRVERSGVRSRIASCRSSGSPARGRSRRRTRSSTRYCPVHNRRFAIPAQDTTPAWRPLRRGLDLDRVCSFRYEATVLNDTPIRLAGWCWTSRPGCAAAATATSASRSASPRSELARLSPVTRDRHRTRHRAGELRAQPRAANMGAAPPPCATSSTPHRGGAVMPAAERVTLDAHTARYSLAARSGQSPSRRRDADFSAKPYPGRT